jgi:hypothetical protein
VLLLFGASKLHLHLVRLADRHEVQEPVAEPQGEPFVVALRLHVEVPDRLPEVPEIVEQLATRGLRGLLPPLPLLLLRPARALRGLDH